MWINNRREHWHCGRGTQHLHSKSWRSSVFTFPHEHRTIYRQIPRRHYARSFGNSSAHFQQPNLLAYCCAMFARHFVHPTVSLQSHDIYASDVHEAAVSSRVSEWVSEQCFTSSPTQYRLYGRRFLQVKRPNQQYQRTEGRSTKEKENNENN